MIEGTITILAESLVLRRLEPDDAEALFAIFGDPEVTRYWSSPPLDDVEAARGLVRSIHDHERRRSLLQWGIAEDRGGEILGTCTLAHLDPGNGRAEIGFALARRAWGRGIATEALRALIGHAFDTLGLRRLEADVDPRNERSIRTMERLGFAREGLLRERWTVAGEVQDSLLMGLLRREWTASRGATDPGAGETAR